MASMHALLNVKSNIIIKIWCIIGGHVRTSLTGVQVGVDVSGSEKVWRTFQAIGDIAFAYAYSNVLIEIQACLFLYIISFLSSIPTIIFHCNYSFPNKGPSCIYLITLHVYHLYIRIPTFSIIDVDIAS